MLLDEVIKFSLDTLGVVVSQKKIDKLKVELKKLKSEVDMIDSIRRFLSNVLNFEIADVKLMGDSWNSRMGPWTWIFIHNTSRWADRNCGTKEKETLVMFYQMFIHCSLCRNHYIESIPGIIDGLKYGSMEDVFLSFHTHISLNTIADFKYDKQLIKREYASPMSLYDKQLHSSKGQL